MRRSEADSAQRPHNGGRHVDASLTLRQHQATRTARCLRQPDPSVYGAARCRNWFSAGTYRGGMRRGLTSVVLLGALVTGCTSTAEPSAQVTRPAPSTALPTPQSSSTPQSSPTPQRPRHQPVVLAVHPSRGTVDLGLGAARAVIAGQVRSWRQIVPSAARPPGDTLRLTGVAGTGVPAARTASLAAALRLVRTDARAVAVVLASAVGPSVRVIRVAGVDPLREPSRYPLRMAGPAPTGPVLTMTIGGDVMLGRRVATAAARAGDPAAPLRPLSRRLAAADLTVLNLESTLSRAGAPRQGGDSFAAPPSVLPGIRAAGVDVLSLANNHTGDFGDQALRDTVARVRAAGIAPVGAGSNHAEAWRPVLVTRAGVRFGFVAFNAIGETPRPTGDSAGAASVRMPPRTGPLNAADVALLTRTVAQVRRSADVVVVLPHWGAQYTHRPDPAQRTVARAALDAGADLVVGGHPHWVQGIDAISNKIVAHSLGNLVFDMDFSRQTQEGFLLELTFWGRRLMAAVPVPYRIGPDFTPRLVTGTTAAAVLRPLWP